ncbi:MAG: transcription termination/antitermination protein NusG [Candidatus Binatia bacterium]
MTAERHWYVVYSKPQKEEYAQFHLRAKRLTVFFPRLLLPDSAKKRRRLLPLFPNYLFVRMSVSSGEYSYALWSPGVSRIVSFNGSPSAIDDGIVNFLMNQANHEGIIEARSNLRSGQEVRITGGPFAGLIGIIQEPPSARGRVKLLLKLLNRPTKVDVPLQFVEGEWVASRPKSEARA